MFEIDLWQHDHTRDEFFQKDGFIIQCHTRHRVQKPNTPKNYYESNVTCFYLKKLFASS